MFCTTRARRDDEELAIASEKDPDYSYIPKIPYAIGEYLDRLINDERQCDEISLVYRYRNDMALVNFRMFIL